MEYVRINRARYWYTDHVGKSFKVMDVDNDTLTTYRRHGYNPEIHHFVNTNPNNVKSVGCVHKEDCTVVTSWYPQSIKKHKIKNTINI
jgi:hypothetical protein